MNAVSNQPTNLPVVWQLVVARQMSELSSLRTYLKSKCTRTLGREHEADPEGTPNGINRTHCHFMLLDYKHTKQALSKFLNSIGLFGSDNFGILTVCSETKKPYSEKLLNQYILKGVVYDDGIFYEGYTENDIRATIDDYYTYKEEQTTRKQNKSLIQYKLKVENPKEQKIRKTDMMKKMIRKIKDDRDIDQQKAAMANDFIVLQAIADVLDEHNEIIGNYKVLDYYDTIIRQEGRGKWMDSMLGMLEKRKPRT